jgi:tetratricopeptide (TPR) repeat protein
MFLLGYHAIVLASIGIRFDLPVENVAILPWGREWSVLRGREGSRADDGKYSPAEKGDYLAILAWSFLVAASGILLRWPSFFGVPNASAYDWIRTAHAGFGAALTVHLLAIHLPQRWWNAPADFRQAILKGTVPLREAEKRGRWVRDLVARGVLVPIPETTESSEDRESVEVRELLERGNRFAREGKYGEACLSYGEALRLLPNYSQARFNLAVALLRDGRSEEAREQLTIFIEKDPFNPMVEKAREMLAGTGKGSA